MCRILFIFHLLVITACLLIGSYAQTSNTIVNDTLNSTLSSITSTTAGKISKNISCEVYNNDCKACVAMSQCYYCDGNDQCIFHIQNIVADGQCNIKDVHFLTCRISFKVMMIIIGVLTGIALLIILIVCCYCCCKKKGIKLSKDDLKWARQKEERKQIAAERRDERAKRTEEIRKKYGLVKDSNPYQRFDA